MKEQRVTLLERISRTPSIESFRFSKSDTLDFIPGQFLQLILNEQNKNDRELNKYLSFSSSPTKEYIEVTKRLSQSAFSKRLAALHIGDGVLVKGPMGGCVFDKANKKIAFLIGGIGITPVISILEYVCDKKFDTDIELYYANRNDEDIAFRNDLDAWSRENKNIKIAYLVSDCPPKDRSCFFGRLDKQFICEKSSCIQERICYIFGPPKMVEAMEHVCKELGCLKENVKTESFLGY